MKVLLINGSPRINGNTTLALNEMVKVFEKNGIETEIVLPLILGLPFINNTFI